MLSISGPKDFGFFVLHVYGCRRGRPAFRARGPSAAAATQQPRRPKCGIYWQVVSLRGRFVPGVRSVLYPEDVGHRQPSPQMYVARRMEKTVARRGGSAAGRS